MQQPQARDRKGEQGSNNREPFRCSVDLTARQRGLLPTSPPGILQNLYDGPDKYYRHNRTGDYSTPNFVLCELKSCKACFAGSCARFPPQRTLSLGEPRGTALGHNRPLVAPKGQSHIQGLLCGCPAGPDTVGKPDPGIGIPGQIQPWVFFNQTRDPHDAVLMPHVILRHRGRPA
jgi:hypothetical protein